MELLLGVRLNPSDKMSVIKLDNVDLKNNVAQFRTKVSEQINSLGDSLDFIYCGCLLENDALLESYGLKNGSMIHVLNKNKTLNKPVSSPSPDININNLPSIYKSFLGNPILEIVLRRLIKRPDIIENIISSTPGLRDDAVAIAILQDPDLLIHFTNSKSIKKIEELHPTLLEAAHHIATAVCDEAPKFSIGSSPGSRSSHAPNSGHSFNLDDLSDDDEMAGDSSQSSDSTQPSSSTTPSRPISNLNSQLLASIARASGRPGNNSSGAMNVSGSPVQPPLSHSNSGGVITFEMFSQAMQQAFASNPAANNLGSVAPAVPPPAPAPSMPSAPSVPLNVPQNSSIGSNLERQITIMHEMGLQNDAVNIQALQITNGDVQAAIELVLSGFGDN